MNSAMLRCVCGHIYYHHDESGGVVHCYFGPHMSGSRAQCDCIGFKIDNLRYLEDRLNEKVAGRD